MMTERTSERIWIVIIGTIVVGLMIFAFADKTNAFVPDEGLDTEYVPWCNGYDDQVIDVDGHCHDIDFFIDAWVDANPPRTVTVIAPHLADQCPEDEAWVAVHYDDPRGVDDIHGVTRACVNHEELVMEGINKLILDGTLIWEWDL